MQTDVGLSPQCPKLRLGDFGDGQALHVAEFYCMAKTFPWLKCWGWLLSHRKAMDMSTVVPHSPGYCSLSKFFLACSLLLFSLASFQRLFSIPAPLRHFRTLHFARCTVSGQAAPPNWGSILIILVLIMWPLPQEVLHSDHWDHSVSSQSMAAGKEKHPKNHTESIRSKHKHTDVSMNLYIPTAWTLSNCLEAACQNFSEPISRSVIWHALRFLQEWCWQITKIAKNI